MFLVAKEYVSRNRFASIHPHRRHRRGRLVFKIIAGKDKVERAACRAAAAAWPAAGSSNRDRTHRGHFFDYRTA